ncbi:UDP-N-acetylmuramoylalanine--D-glutamate ligase [Bienertia sinuspersici]
MTSKHQGVTIGEGNLVEVANSHKQSEAPNETWACAQLIASMSKQAKERLEEGKEGAKYKESVGMKGEGGLGEKSSGVEKWKKLARTKGSSSSTMQTLRASGKRDRVEDIEIEAEEWAILAPFASSRNELQRSWWAKVNLIERLGFQGAFGVSSQGNSGGLCVYWRDEANFTLVSYSHLHICGDVRSKCGGEWCFVGIYGWANVKDKHKTWKLIQHLYEDSNKPILFGGDFNEILRREEKDGGSEATRREILHFRQVMDDYELRDLGFPW